MAQFIKEHIMIFVTGKLKALHDGYITRRVFDIKLIIKGYETEETRLMLKAKMQI